MLLDWFKNSDLMNEYIKLLKLKDKKQINEFLNWLWWKFLSLYYELNFYKTFLTDELNNLTIIWQ